MKDLFNELNVQIKHILDTLGEDNKQELKELFDTGSLIPMLQLVARELKLLNIEYVMILNEDHPLLKMLDEQEQLKANVQFTPYYDTTKVMQ